MSAFVADWLNLLIRWAHLIAGIGWIGTSFYFIALDLSLKKRDRMGEGVHGTAWEVHGGGFYHVEKYTVAPKELPDDLIWYKWEAYLTWVTGFLLLLTQYYWHATAYLIDPGVLKLAPAEAVAISIVSLIVGWFAYDGLCRSPLGKNPVWLAAAVFLLILAVSYVYSRVYSARGALIHVGALIGTIMAANVFAVIIPNQKKIVEALIKGQTPDPALGAKGKQRSLHNTYLTLPVLLMMVSNHYAFLTNHPHAWILVGLVLVMGAGLRPFPGHFRGGRAVGEDRLDVAGHCRRARGRDGDDRAARGPAGRRDEGQRRPRDRDHPQALRRLPCASRRECRQAPLDGGIFALCGG